MDLAKIFFSLLFLTILPKNSLSHERETFTGSAVTQKRGMAPFFGRNGPLW